MRTRRTVPRVYRSLPFKVRQVPSLHNLIDTATPKHSRLMDSIARFTFSMASTLRAVTIVACLLSQVQHVQSKICYESSGFESETYYDCAPDADVSACCRPGDICYSNGLCHPGPEVEQGITAWFWHGCTDPTFQDPSCFSACFSGKAIRCMGTRRSSVSRPHTCCANSC